MALGDHTLLLSCDGSLWTFGCNSQGQLGLGHKANLASPAKVPGRGPRPVQVDWGDEHSLDEEGGVWEAGLARLSSPSLTFERVPGSL